MAEYCIPDNSEKTLDFNDKSRLDLQRLDGVKISALAADSDLLVFPTNPGDHGDKIGDKHIFEMTDDGLISGNVMGYVGINETELRIVSRFTPEKEKDFFLHYMLEKVFAVNIFRLDHSSGQEDVLDFRLFLFPHFLKKAFRQGLYKEYRYEQYNDANVRGRIDVKQHLRRNMPFAGNVAYGVRTFSHNNYLIQLIRHAIEYIAQKPMGFGILNGDDEMRSIVSQIRRLTPDYHKSDRRKVMSANLKKFTHPYYTAYKDLQTLCVRILRQEGLKYGNSKDRIHGVLFDGSWLWEEYLNTVLRPLDLVHPENNTGLNGIPVFEIGSLRYFPDFYNETMVLDAKYKRLKDNNVSREDMHQIITYLFLRRVKFGGFICPVESTCSDEVSSCLGNLNGYGGDLFVWKLPVPQQMEAYSAFCGAMEKNERDLIRRISSAVTGSGADAG